MSDKDYEDGVRNGQRGGFLDDLAQGIASTGSDYDKGYNYGVEHRRDSSGERYHTWSGDGKNDPKPDSGNSSDWFSDFFSSGSKGSASVDESSETESSTSTSSSEYSSGGGGGGGSYSGSGGSGTKAKSGGLAKLLGLIFIGGIIYLGTRNNLVSSYKASPSQEETPKAPYSTKIVETNVKTNLKDIEHIIQSSQEESQRESYLRIKETEDNIRRDQQRREALAIESCEEGIRRMELDIKAKIRQDEEKIGQRLGEYIGKKMQQRMIQKKGEPTQEEMVEIYKQFQQEELHKKRNSR